eukprot:6122054-Pyramimonas_sp.AAC.1
MRGSIPSSLPQTAVLTEHHALMNMVEHIEAGSEDQHFYLDCAAVVWGALDPRCPEEDGPGGPLAAYKVRGCKKLVDP